MTGVVDDGRVLPSGAGTVGWHGTSASGVEQGRTRRAIIRAGAGVLAATGTAALAACGAAGAPAAGPAPALKAVQGRVEFWALNNPMLETFGKEFAERNAGATVEFVPRANWVELFEKLYAAIAGDTGPDLVRVKEYNAIDLGAIKALQPLDDFIKTDKTFKADQFTPEQWKTANFDGAQYGVPFYNSIHVLLWSKPFFEAAGLAPDKGPQSWGEPTPSGRSSSMPSTTPPARGSRW